MKIDKNLELELIDLINALVNGDFDKISAKNWYGGLKKNDIEARIFEHPYGHANTQMRL